MYLLVAFISCVSHVTNCYGAQDITVTTLNTSETPATDIKSTFGPTTVNTFSARSLFYSWSKNEDTAVMVGKALQDHILTRFSNEGDVRFCAMECLKSSLCESFNYQRTTGLCELNTVSHINNEHDLVDYSSKDYYPKNVFWIAKEALGVCYGNTCSSHGRCFELRLTPGNLSAVCLCDPGWQGSNCTEPELVHQWSSWIDWSLCSVTCLRGWQKRQRLCSDVSAGVNVSPALCPGVPAQYKQCDLNNCPRWSQWGAWGQCSTSKTCGIGQKTKRRTCLNGGQIGVDRFCLGLDTETTPCYSIHCFGPLRLTNGSGPYEGRIELYDNLNKKWTSICANQMTEFVASLACKQAGWPGPYKAIRDARYGSDGVSMSLYSIQCTGSEHSLTACSHNVWTTTAQCSDGSFVPAAVQCNVNGVWSLWSTWGDCSVSCNNGTRSRHRYCNQPKMMYNGVPCQGAITEQKFCLLSTCPVNGNWSNWEAWSDCTLTCGNGTQSRLRQCIGPFHGGANCSGDYKDIKMCKDKDCPIDGQWEEWNMWLDCTQTCGGGIRTRNRSCNGPYNDGQPCIGTSYDVKQCYLQQCPVDGEWLQWDSWTQCTVTCGGGHQSRKRQCQQPLYGGVQCPGGGNETQLCNQQLCPIDGVWSTWSVWSQCSSTCGQGVQQRNRTCNGPLFGGSDCSGAVNETQTCNLYNCPVDGQWMEWQSWSPCSVTCGVGKKNRKRDCYLGLYGGNNCTGSYSEEQLCNETSCPVDGKWMTWSLWGQCSQTCGNGYQSRERLCDGPFFGGANCLGAVKESQSCNNQSCAVDGFFSEWSTWTTCTLSCGSGQQTRHRTCIGPMYGGKNCSGDFDELQICNNAPCPIDGFYMAWSEWNQCTETCGSGIQYRNRTCIQPLYGGLNCQGHNKENQACNNNPCPVDGYYTEWGVWSLCTVTCGGGNQWRNRSCTPPKYGGLDCIGPANVTENCNSQPCPIDGFWTSWSQWTSCSTTCGGGQQQKNRLCQEPLFGGKPCDGLNAEYLRCSENPCPIPGLWLPWSPWTPCSATCGGGSHIRERICNTTSFGNLTAPCPGSTKENASCHTFNCLPLARTCTELKQRGLIENVMAEVDPDGPELYSLESVIVYCDMVSHNESGVTVIGHNQEIRTEVQGWEGAREYEAVLIYNVSFEHAISIVDQSSYCEQYIRWECYAALIHNYNDNNKITTGWLNRTKGVADYFGDAPPGSNNCTCGTRHACVDPSYGCNCDANDHVWRVDDGYMTFKDDLPVYAFVAGDTGGSDEEGFSTVGPLRCWGPVQKNP